MRTLPKKLGHVVASILSLLAAFFGVFLSLFSDVFGLQQQAGAVLYVLIVYVIGSSLMHWLWRGHGRAWVLWFVIPAAVFTLFTTLTDNARLVYPLSIIAAAMVGSWVGKKIFDRRPAVSAPPSNPPTA